MRRRPELDYEWKEEEEEEGGRTAFCLLTVGDLVPTTGTTSELTDLHTCIK